MSSVQAFKCPLLKNASNMFDDNIFGNANLKSLCQDLSLFLEPHRTFIVFNYRYEAVDCLPVCHVRIGKSLMHRLKNLELLLF